MSSTVSTPEAFIESFPATPVKIEGQPNYDSLSALREVLKQNAASVSTDRGGGQHGYLGIILSDAMYATIAPNDAFVRPAAPANTPTIPAGGTAAAIAEAVRLHADELRQWREYVNLTAALRLQLVKCIEPVYLRSQLNRHVGYANSTPRQLLEYLFLTYGKLTPQRLSENHEAMTKPWSPNMPFEDLIDQIEVAMDMATEGNQGYSAAQVLNVAYTQVYNTGLYFDECKIWNAKPVADKTWENFKIHFLEAQTELRTQQQATSGRHGYGNWAEENKENETAAAIAKLAEATIQDQGAFCALAEANTNLSKQLEEAIKCITSFTAKQGQGKENADKRKHTPNTNYCWSHGFRVGKDHTSTTCKFPKEGHKKEATITSMLGGSTAGEGT
jgi:hypothetical protein